MLHISSIRPHPQVHTYLHTSASLPILCVTHWKDVPPRGCLAPWAPSGYLHPEGVQPTNPSFLSLHLTLSWPTLCFHIHNNDLLFGSMILSGSRKFLFQTFSEHFMAVLQISDKTTELHVQTPSVAFCAETYLIPRTGFILGCDCRQEVTSATSDSLHTLLTQSNREIKHRQT